MGRKTGSTPWHATALKLQAQGLTAQEIHAALAETSAPPNLPAIKKFLQRAKAEPSKALQIAVNANQVEMPPLPPLSPEDGKTMTDLFMVVEKQRARLLGKAMDRLDRALGMTPGEMSAEKDGISLALRVIEVLKLPTSIAPEFGETSPGGGERGGGGSGGPKNNLNDHRVEFEVIDPQAQEQQGAPNQA